MDCNLVVRKVVMLVVKLALMVVGKVERWDLKTEMRLVGMME